MALRRLSTSSIQTNGKSSKLWDQETTLGTFESIATATVDSSGASTISFSNIPQNYAHLQIRAIARGTQADASDQIGIQFNSDTGSNYAIHQVGGNGSSVFSTGGGSQTKIVPAYITGGSTSANIFGVGIIDILDYTNTNKYTTVRGLSGYDSNGAGLTLLRSGLWLNTNAVTSIVCVPDSGSFVQYSFFALYGIRGA